MEASKVLNDLVGRRIPRSAWDMLDASMSINNDEQWRGIFDFEFELFRLYQEDAREAMEEEVDELTDEACEEQGFSEDEDDYEEVRRRVWSKIRHDLLQDDDSYDFHDWIGERFPDYQQKMWELWNLSDYAVFFEDDTVEVERIPHKSAEWFGVACDRGTTAGINRNMFDEEGLRDRVHRFSTRGARDYAESYAMKKGGE